MAFNIILIFLCAVSIESASAFGNELEERYSIQGAITSGRDAGATTPDQSPIALLRDKFQNKTLVLRVGDPLPGTSYKIVEVSPKEVVADNGRNKVTFHKDAFSSSSFSGGGSVAHSDLGSNRISPEVDDELDEPSPPRDKNYNRYTRSKRAPGFEPPLPPATEGYRRDFNDRYSDDMDVDDDAESLGGFNPYR